MAAKVGEVGSGVVEPLGKENRRFNADLFVGVVQNISVASTDQDVAP